MSQGNFKFGTTVNCMDGRAVEATIDWMKRSFDLNYVDAITEPGMDNFVRNLDEAKRAWLKRKLEISIKNHGSRVVSIVGHEDCAGNPVSKEEHAKHIHEGVKIVEALVKEIDPRLNISITGLWLTPSQEGKQWAVETL